VIRTSKAPSATSAGTGTTRARRTVFGIACLCVLGLTAFLGSSAPSVGAAESFPGQGFLPHNRAWEMVSPPDKNGGNIAAVSERSRAASNGDAIQFVSLAGFADAKGSGVSFEYIARRTAEPSTNGWSTHAITPVQEGITPADVVLANGFGTPHYVGEFSPDLSRGVFSAYSPVPTGSDPHPMVEKTYNFYLGSILSTPGTPSYELISDCPGCTEPLTYNPFSGYLAMANSNGGDADHEPITNVLYEATKKLTPDATNAQKRLYEGTKEATDEIQVVMVNAEAGQFTLSFDGETTSPIAFDTPASGLGSVETALNALPAIAPGVVSVTGGPGDAGATNPYVVSFVQGPGIQGTDVPQLTAASGPTPLSGGAATVSTTTRLGGGQHVRLAGRIPAAPLTSCDDSAAPACVANVTSIAGSNVGALGRNYAVNTVSSDGSRVFFRAPATGSQRHLYLREDGLRTINLNVSEASTPTASQGTEYWAASNDGSKVFFSTGQALIDEDTNGLTDLYMYDATKPPSAPDNLTLISKGSGSSGGLSAVLGASANGSYVYFAGSIQLVAGEPPGGSNLFLWHEGTVSYIGNLFIPSDLTLNALSTQFLFSNSVHTARVSNDGRSLLFMASDSTELAGEGGFSGYDHSTCTTITNGGAPCRQLFVYAADKGTLRCVSCSPSGVSTMANGDALINVRRLIGGDINVGDQHRSHALSDDGRYVFFHTGEPLIKSDTNGQVDVYVYDTVNEEQRLISSGESSRPSYFIDASDNGRDVFFVTSEQLSKWDVDSLYDVYDARVDGGVPEPLPPPPSCQGDACQPAPVSLNDPTPSSSSLQGQGDPSPNRNRRMRCPKGKRRVKGRSGKARCVRSKRGTNNGRRAGR
jgi:hypothetical protein